MEVAYGVTQRIFHVLLLHPFSMNQSIPIEFTEADEAFLLSILHEMLHPTPGQNYLSEQFVSQLESRNGYLLLLMVRVGLFF